MKEEHTRSLTRVHNDCARMIYGVTRWHHQHQKLTLKEVLGALQLDPLGKTIDERTLKFVAKVAQLPDDNVTHRVVFCQAKPNPTAKACIGPRHTHTKGRYFKILHDNHFIEPSKDSNHKLGSTDAWQSELEAWKDGGSKLQNWEAPATLPTSFYDLDLTPPPAQAFTLNPNAPTVWFPSLRPIFNLFPSIETPFINLSWSFLSPLAAQFFF
jgi:hypothetical protein